MPPPHHAAVTSDYLSAALAADVLREAIERLADVHVVEMHGRAGRLDTSGPRPQLWLNECSAPQDWARVLMDAMRILVLGLPPETARAVRRLAVVS